MQGRISRTTSDPDLLQPEWVPAHTDAVSVPAAAVTPQVERLLQASYNRLLLHIAALCASTHAFLAYQNCQHFKP